MYNIHLLFHTGKCGSRSTRISCGIFLKWDGALQGAHRGRHSSHLEECHTYTVSPPPPTPSVTYSLHALKYTALHQKYFLLAVTYKVARLSNVILLCIAWLFTTHKSYQGILNHILGHVHNGNCFVCNHCWFVFDIDMDSLWFYLSPKGVIIE